MDQLHTLLNQSDYVVLAVPLTDKTEKLIGEAINRGAANGIATIANKLFEAANNGNVTAQIFFLKARAGWRDRACLVELLGEADALDALFFPTIEEARLAIADFVALDAPRR